MATVIASHEDGDPVRSMNRMEKDFMYVQATACGQVEGPPTWMATARPRSLQTGLMGL